MFQLQLARMLLLDWSATLGRYRRLTIRQEAQKNLVTAAENKEVSNNCISLS
jgi:hypothetical protein